MQPTSDDISHVLERLEQGPVRLEAATRGVEVARLQLRTEAEPWSVGDILAHLRACSDAWAKSITAMLTQENPTMRYVSPRSWMKKPLYRDATFATALDAFTQERHALIQRLASLDEADWARRGTFTGTSARQRNQTVMSYAERIANHEAPHLDQIERLLQTHQAK